MTKHTLELPAHPNDRGVRLGSQRGLIMKIVVIGGSGLIGSKLVTRLGWIAAGAVP